MSDVDANLKAVLSGLGASVYALKRPVDSHLPTLVYRRITETDFVAHNGVVDLAKSRFQITHVASTYSGLRSLVNSVKTALLGNNINFNASIATDIHIEDKESDNIFTAVKDYFIWN